MLRDRKDLRPHRGDLAVVLAGGRVENLDAAAIVLHHKRRVIVTEQGHEAGSWVGFRHLERGGRSIRVSGAVRVEAERGVTKRGFGQPSQPCFILVEDRIPAPCIPFKGPVPVGACELCHACVACVRQEEGPTLCKKCYLVGAEPGCVHPCVVVLRGEVTGGLGSVVYRPPVAHSSQAFRGVQLVASADLKEGDYVRLMDTCPESSEPGILPYPKPAYRRLTQA